MIIQFMHIINTLIKDDDIFGFDIGKSIDEQLQEQWNEIMRPKTKKDWKQYYWLKREKKKQKYLARRKAKV